MEDSWRFRPIAGHQICPVCSVPHYPFCPPPLAFSHDGLRCFPAELRPQPFHRLVYDLSPPPPFPVPPARGSAPFQPAPYPQAFVHEEAMVRENLRKRMRVEDPGMGMHHPIQQFNRHFPADVERRLNLIRDHGMQSSTLLLQDESPQICGDNWMYRHPYDVKQNLYSGFEIDNGFQDTAYGNRGIHFQPKTYQGLENQQTPTLQRDDRFRPQLSTEYRRPEFDSDGRIGSETFFLRPTEDSSLKDSWKQASYSTNDSISSRMVNCDDQLAAQSIQSPSTLFQNHHPYSRTDNFHMTPYHEEYSYQNHGEIKSDFDKLHGDSRRASFESSPPVQNEAHKPLDPHSYLVEQPGSCFSKQATHLPVSAEVSFMPTQGHTSLAYPPFPPRPLFPVRAEPSLPNPQVKSHMSASSVSGPITGNPSVKAQLSAYGSHSLPYGEFHNELRVQQTSSGHAVEGLPLLHRPTLNLDDKGSSHAMYHSCKDEPTFVDASQLFKHPYRASRPDRIVIILRGLPGSGKSYLAKAIRDLEVENGGGVPRIHAMDDYFMIEVEKAEDNDGSKLSGSARSKKQAMKKVIEYCYEPEMEEVYRSSMLKAFKKTLDEGTFTFVIEIRI
ncbi:hypothetical protein AXF42_Ash007240 [Apostasia shenzhenica]|uniref:YLP motif-containing protein 1 n=1 Tax=Apostasia shenzhenica TaxID=1088818 RepID=A0A2I0B9L2_9ASPA|nr:hypothetical protein AXF42_Ash007240 [Apostasia shenzhenica]